MHQYSATLILRTRKNANGKSPILLQMFINRERVRVSTGIQVPPNNWDKKTAKVIHKGTIDREEASDINLALYNKYEKAQTIFREYRIRDVSLNKELMLAELESTLHRNSFHDWVWKEIEALQGVRAPKTLAQYKVSFRALKEFSPVIRFSDLTPEFVERWDRWLKVERKIRLNSRSKYHKHLKTFSRALARHYKGIPDIYQFFKVKQVPGKRDYLNRTEVQALTRMYDAHVLGEKLQEMLAMFLFSCHTGLRYSDLVTVQHKNISNGYLTFMPLKTQGIEKRIDVPLNPEALRLIQTKKGELFRNIGLNHYSRSLKEIARLCGIEKNISSHVGRHTFATGYIMNGGRTPVLKRILGHSKLETTEIYMHLSKQMIEEERTVIDNMYKTPQLG